MPELDTLPKDYQDLVNQGWYQNEAKGSKYSGVPETEQERAWIIDYMQRTGEVPTLGQANEAMRGVDRTQYQYTPESTMGGLGFKDWNEYISAQQAGESYGPWSGRHVPEGGLVTTDEYGRPSQRYMNLEGARGAMGQGRFVMPPGGLTREQWGKYSPTSSGFPKENLSDIYPQYRREKFQAPTLEEALGGNPQATYKARVYDYLTNLSEQHAPELQDLTQFKKDAQTRLNLVIEGEQQKQLDNPKYADQAKKEIAQATLDFGRLSRLIDEKIETFMTPQKAEGILGQAANLINKGYSGPDLPYFAESMNTTGGQVAKLWTEATGRAQEAYKGQRMGPLQGPASVIDFQRQVLEAQARHPNVRYSMPTEEVLPTRNHQKEFTDYVRQLNINDYARQWLFDNYAGLFGQWQGSGSGGDFVGWLQRYLAGVSR